MPPIYDDSALLAEARHPDGAVRRAAFERLLTQYEKLMWHVARRYLGCDEDAQDACQEAAFKVYQALPRAVLPASGSLKAWVCTVTARCCLDALRKRKPPAVPVEDAALPAEPSAEDEALARGRAADILRAMESLSHDHRMIIILRDIQGFSYQELSEATGAPAGTVKSRLARAREALRRALET